MRITKGLLIVILAVSALLPLALLLVWSFSLRWYYPALWPSELSVRAWQALFAPTSQIWEALGGSVWVASAVTALAVPIALPAARVLAGATRARGPVTALILSPLVLPAFAGVMGVQVVFIKLGLADTRAGVVIAQLIPAVPYAVVLLTGVFQQYDSRLEEAARSLGASRGRVFTRVTLPLILPGMLIAALFAFLVSWGEYLLTLIVGGGQVTTLPLLLFASAAGGDLAITAALALVYVAPTLLIFAVVARGAQGWRT